VSTPVESLAYPEGVVDVSVLVPACFENPLKEYSIEFIEGVLTRNRAAVVPVTALIGAYHVLTRYLRVPKVDAKRVLDGILRSGSPSLYPYVAPEVAADALEYALAYGVESWDGYLVSLTRRLGSTLVYTLDKELARVREITAVNPFPGEAVERYHEYLRDKLG
jgi:predicted nucleic acid-binding protein